MPRGGVPRRRRATPSHVKTEAPRKHEGARAARASCGTRPWPWRPRRPRSARPVTPPGTPHPGRSPAFRLLHTWGTPVGAPTGHAPMKRPPAGRRQVKAPPRTHAKGKGPHLSERVLVGLVVPRVVVALDEREVLCLLSLERGRPAVGVGGKVALARETQAGCAVSAGSAGRRSRKPHTRGPHGRGPLHRVRVSSLARGTCHTPGTEPAVQDPSPPPPRALSPAANALCGRRGPALTEPDRSSPSRPALFAPVVPAARAQASRRSRDRVPAAITV